MSCGKYTPRRLKIVKYEGKLWWFDDRLRQLRTVKPPLEFQDLDDFEMEYFKKAKDVGKMI